LSHKETIKAVGILGDHIIPGLEYEIKGKRHTHPKFGEQIRIKNIKCTKSTAESEDNIVSYLCHFNGIGPKTAALIHAEYGSDAVRIVKEEPELLIDIKGISSRKVDEIGGQLTDMKDDQDLIDFLLLHGVSTYYLKSIKERFGNHALFVLKNNPYELTRIKGIGFITADRMAQKFGIDPKSSMRIRAAVSHYLFNDNRGHIYLDADTLIQGVIQRYLGNIGWSLIDIEINNMVRDGEVVSEETGSLTKSDTLSDLAYSKYHYNTEVNVAKAIFRIRKTHFMLPGLKLPWTPELKTISAEQKAAVDMGLNEKVSVIHGPAGSGKSTIISEMIQAAQYNNVVPLVVSFTGRAAQRVKEISQFENCQTIHRALKYTHGRGFLVNENEPLGETMVIVDEASMVGLDLVDSLTRAMPMPNHQICFVGDPAQLPSLSNGNLMHSLINCNAIPTTYLDFVYRNQSMILKNANKIREGKWDLETDETFMMSDSKDDLLVIPLAYSSSIKFPMQDTLVISGIKKGAMGVYSLNLMLQDLFGKTGSINIGANYKATMGDKVIQTHNDYNKGVFNGNIGWVTDMKAPDYLEVTFDTGEAGRSVVQYTGAHELKALELAYCITVHKAQGSESKNVFVILDPSHYMVHSRNWLYTAVTRAQESVTLIGSEEVLKECAETPDVSIARNSKLEQRITSLWNAK
tara:strand:- start:1139 stop:3205 length:2067 start_codon:yes stop_codon:yes gene_type:complete